MCDSQTFSDEEPLIKPTMAFGTEEEREDYLDYCAAAEAIDEALETGEIRDFEDFAKEEGLQSALCRIVSRS